MKSLHTISLILAVAAAGCGEAEDYNPAAGAFKVTWTAGSPPPTNSAANPRAFSATEETFTVDIQALRHDRAGQVSTDGYNGYVMLKAMPTGKLNRDPFTVELKNGKATGIKVGLSLAYGHVRLVAVDPGYKEAKVLADAACNNGKDDDGDGYIDSEDRGCLVGGDDSEEGGTGAAGASPTIYYANPRLYDIQNPEVPGAVGDESPLNGQRVTVDKGWLLVTNLSSDGLYVTDFEGAKWNATSKVWKIAAQDLSYDHMFAFNFNVPLNLQVGDCLVELDGKVEEFFGYTEMGFPNWKKGDNKFCYAKAKAGGMAACPTDGTYNKDCWDAIKKLASTPVDLSKPVDITDKNGTTKVWPFKDLTTTERWEAGLVQVSNVKLFSKARICDRNGNGEIDFNDPNDPSGAEKNCANGCGDDETCIVNEQFQEYSQWSVNFKASLGGVDYKQEVSVTSGGSIPNWNAMKGCDFKKSSDGLSCTRATDKTLTKVLGTMRSFRYGRPPWIIQTRSPADCPDCVNK